MIEHIKQEIENESPKTTLRYRPRRQGTRKDRKGKDFISKQTHRKEKQLTPTEEQSNWPSILK